jgi:hypothetical protein
MPIPCRSPVNHLYLQARENPTWPQIFIRLARTGRSAADVSHIDQVAARGRGRPRGTDQSSPERPEFGLAVSGVSGVLVLLRRRVSGPWTVLVPSPQPTGQHEGAEKVQRRNYPARAARSSTLRLA